MPEHDEPDAPEHEHDFALSTWRPFQMRCKVCGARPTKAERLNIETK